MMMKSVGIHKPVNRLLKLLRLLIRFISINQQQGIEGTFFFSAESYQRLLFGLCQYCYCYCQSGKIRRRKEGNQSRLKLSSSLNQLVTIFGHKIDGGSQGTSNQNIIENSPVFPHMF
jgi:hypothetical protein